MSEVLKGNLGKSLPNTENLKKPEISLGSKEKALGRLNLARNVRTDRGFKISREVKPTPLEKTAVPPPEQPSESEEAKQEEPKPMSEETLTQAEALPAETNQDQLKSVVDSMRSQLKEIQAALAQGSEVREKVRKGIFDKKVVFLLRLINILANNEVITKLLNLDSKIADIKDLWGEYQGMKDKTKSIRKSPDTVQVAEAATGEAPDKGSEVKEADFESSNISFIKEKAQEFLQQILAELKSSRGEDFSLDQITAQINDEIDSLVDGGKELDLRKSSETKPGFLEKLREYVQNFARGKGSKDSLGLKIVGSLKS